jgi:hypothetical protein
VAVVNQFSYEAGWQLASTAIVQQHDRKSPASRKSHQHIASEKLEAENAQ